MPLTILSINPGSTSTKVAVYADETPLFVKNLQHPAEELGKFGNLLDQFELRKQYVLQALAENDVKPESLSAVVGRGGLLPPVNAGGYAVNQAMLDALRKGRLHASNLGAYIASSIAEPLGIPAYVYDAVASDEFFELARFSGLPGAKRRSLSHVLNSKAAGRKAAAQLGGKYEDMNFIICHMGGGITTSAHLKGRMVDIVCDDEGAFSPERSGRVPHEALIALCEECKNDKRVIMDRLKKTAGLMGLLGTNDCLEVQKRIADGDEEAKLVYDTMIYQLARDVTSMAAALCGKIDAVVLTGGIAYSEYIVSGMRPRVEFLGPFIVLPGENEMESLTLGALRMLRGEESCSTFA